jgi:large subunit ribosomal protein L25
MAFAEHLAFAKGLPPRLLRFFEKHPPVIPRVYAPKPQPAEAASSSAIEVAQIAPQAEEVVARPFELYNPFQPYKHPVTGRWHNPKYSLRQQSDLVKLATENGLEHLLPTTLKGKEEKLARRMEGLRVKGTGVGQKVKGHWQERTLHTRLEKRRQAMLDMPGLIYNWKKVRRTSEMQKFPLTIASLEKVVVGRNTPDKSDNVLNDSCNMKFLQSWTENMHGTLEFKRLWHCIIEGCLSTPKLRINLVYVPTCLWQKYLLLKSQDKCFEPVETILQGCEIHENEVLTDIHLESVLAYLCIIVW